VNDALAIVPSCCPNCGMPGAALHTVIECLVELVRQRADLRAALDAAREYVEMAAQEEEGYGFFPGGDPRAFHPDVECCKPNELAAHKADCEAWDAGNQVHSVRYGREVTEHEGKVASVHFSGYGLGTYTYRDPAAVEALGLLERALHPARVLGEGEHITAAKAAEGS
jgi:hypothetical protein